MNNPSLYRKLSEPFESKAELNKALDEFQSELGALREKHHMRDCVVILGFSYLTDSGEECEGTVLSQFGDMTKHEAYIAYALGTAQHERQDFIGALLSKGIKKGVKG